jgi:DNA-binding transcriptional regulator YhcF (GntR family)
VQLTIDRAQATPVYQQIKGQIAYEIGTGVLRSGDRLPTIRQLAADLGVAPLTVMQAFEELQKEGLIEVRPGVGAFVVDLRPEVLERSRRSVLEGVVTAAVAEANCRGISEREFARAVWELVFPDAAPGGPRALFVGNYDDDTPLLAAALAAELAVQRLGVDACTIEQLRRPTPALLARLDDADLVVAVPLRFADVRRLVGDRKQVFGLPIVVGPTAREHLAQLPAATVVGLVARQASFMQSMRNVVAIYRPATATAPVASFDDEAGVVALLREVEAVIYSMGVRERIQPLIPRNVLAIELSHVPDPAALDELRQTLAALTAGAPADGGTATTNGSGIPETGTRGGADGA